MSLVFLGILLIAAYGAGGFAIALLRIEHPRNAAGFALAASLGTAVLGTVALLLGGMGLLRPIALIGVAMLAAGYGVRDVAAWVRGRAPAAAPGGRRLEALERVSGAATILACALRLAWFAWYPDLRIDAYMYHITVPQQWLLRGWASAFAYEPHASFHLLWDSWYAYGLAFARDDFILPALWHSLAAVGVALLLRGELLRRGHPRIADAAAVAWLLATEVLESSPCAYVDNAVALYVFAGGIVLSRASSRGEGLLAGLFLGAAIATKATSLAFLVAALAAWILASLLSGTRRDLSRIAGALVVGAVPMVLPWVIRNAVTTGNPFYPFLPDLFPARPEFDSVGRDFLASYPGIFSDSGEPGMGAAGLAAHANLFLANTRLLPQNFFAVAMFVAGLLAFPKWRKLPVPTTMLGLLGLGLLPMVVMSPARRFVLGAEALHILGCALVAGELLRGAAWVRTTVSRAVAMAGALLLLMPAWRAGNEAQAGFEHRRPPDDRRWYLTPGEIRTGHHERHPDAGPPCCSSKRFDHPIACSSRRTRSCSRWPVSAFIRTDTCTAPARSASSPAGRG